jgi:hypothetical protein
MTLKPDPNTPGLWVNSDWQEGNAGTFAVIIGVSDYDHLNNGKGVVAANTYGLGQLYVSALTAYRFFEWLRDTYSYTNCPLAKCWLLLAPTQAEIAAAPGIADNPQAPTLDACDTAINTWYATMKALALQQAADSRSFFFFSGHGLELTSDNQVLIPSDYLRPPGTNINRALSAASIYAGVAVLRVPQTFFFIDACRNDAQELRAADIKGTPMLTGYQSFATNPDRNAPVIYATAAGTQAWQPMTPDKGPSLFGQALLDGLLATAGFQPDCTVDPCAVQLSPLHRFLRGRVLELLKAANSTAIQRVLQGGDCSDLFATVTEVKRPAAPPPPAPPAPAPVPSPGPAPVRPPISFAIPPAQDIGDQENANGGTRGLGGAGVGAEVAAAAPPAQPTMAAALDELYTERFVGLNLNVARDGFGPSHAVLGSEHTTGMWASARVYNLRRREWLPDNNAYLIHKVERSGTDAYRIELSIPDNPDTHWLQLPGDNEDMFGCLLAPDYSGTTRYVIELTRDPNEAKTAHTLVGMEASLSLENDGMLGRAAALWEKYTTLSIADAAEDIDMRFAEEALQSKLQSPLAATVAAIILLRARRHDMLHDWLRNLATWFNDLPDGPVLRTEQLLRQSKTKEGTAEAITWMLEVRRRGLPLTAEALSLADKQLDVLLRSRQPNKEQREGLRETRQWLNRGLHNFRPGGLFTTLHGPASKVKPELVLGSR